MTEAQISIENLGDTTTSNLKMSEQKEEKIVLLSEAENRLKKKHEKTSNLMQKRSQMSFWNKNFIQNRILTESKIDLHAEIENQSPKSMSRIPLESRFRI